MITTQENFTVHIVRQNGRILMAVRDNNADGEIVLRMYLTDKDAAAHRAGLERLTLTPAPSLSFDAPTQRSLL